MKMIRITHLIHIYSILLIIIVYALIITVYNQVQFEKQKEKNEDDLYKSFGKIIPSELSERITTEKQIQIKSDGASKGIKAFIKRINLSQTVYNLYLGPVNHRSNVIVIQVHSNVFYFGQLLVSMQNAHGIANSLLIFSHDRWDETINELVKAVRFAKYIQIFYPYSLQLYQNAFPGADSKLCIKGSVCKNSTLRDPKASQAKLHWWWLANQVFDDMAILSNYDNDILFLEEGNYVTTDFLYMYRTLRDLKTSYYSYCDLMSLAADKHLHTEQYNKVQDMAVIEAWTDAMPKTGLAFNRETWKAIKTWSKDFCYYNDSRWDRSLKNLKNRIGNGTIYVISTNGPRVFLLDECNKNLTCNSLIEVQNFVDAISKDLFPRNLTIWSRKERNVNTKPSGDWLDIRDQKLCMHFNKHSLWY